MCKEKKEKKNTQPLPEAENKSKTQEESAEEGIQEITILKAEYEELRNKAGEKDELWDKYLRLYADYDNAKKHWDKRTQELLKFGNFRILKEFITVLDEIEAAKVSLANSEKEHFAKGIEMICTKIKNILEKEGVRQIPALDKPFDPHLHEVLFFEERKDLEEHTIIEVIQQGYSYEDKILRPAKVKVSVKKIDNKEEKTD